MVILDEDNYSVTSFTGINEASDPQYIQDNEVMEALNVLLGPRGELTKRRPLSRITSLQASAGVYPAIIAMVQLILTQGFGGTTYTLLHDASLLKTYYLTDPNLTTTQIPGFDNKIIWDAVQFNNKIYAACELSTGGGAGIHTWTQAAGAVELTGTPTSIRQIIAFKSRLFGFVGPRLYYSDAVNPDSWPVANFIDVNPGDGQDITCLIPIGDRLLIFKSNSVYALFFADDPLYWIVHCVHFTIGCRGPRAAKLAGSLIYFISRDGLYVTDGNVFSRISDPIRDAFSESRDLTFDIYGDHTSIVKDWIFFHVKGYGDFAYRYTSPRGLTRLSWNVGTGNYLWRDIFEQKLFGQPGRFLASIDDKLYYFVTWGTSGSESVPTVIGTKRYDLSRISHIKRMKYADMFLATGATGQTVAISWYRDANELMSLGLPNVTNLQPAVTGTKIRGAEYNRVVGFRMTETSNQKLSFYGFNFIGHTHRQQIEGNQ